jgi:heme-degrading monooxygenase HmoA
MTYLQRTPGRFGEVVTRYQRPRQLVASVHGYDGRYLLAVQTVTSMQDESMFPTSNQDASQI